MIRFHPLPPDAARHYRAGGHDANGQPPERLISDGVGYPCRHCLKITPKGRGVLLVAHRPFPAPQPCAEIGPIFLCEDNCGAPAAGPDRPAMLSAPDYILRGYDARDRIFHGTGRVVATDAIGREAEATLADPRVRYLHLRSARNNCYQLRIDRG